MRRTVIAAVCSLLAVTAGAQGETDSQAKAVGFSFHEILSMTGWMMWRVPVTDTNAKRAELCLMKGTETVHVWVFDWNSAPPDRPRPSEILISVDITFPTMAARIGYRWQVDSGGGSDLVSADFDLSKVATSYEGWQGTLDEPSNRLGEIELVSKKKPARKEKYDLVVRFVQ